MHNDWICPGCVGGMIDKIELSAQTEILGEVMNQLECINSDVQTDIDAANGTDKSANAFANAIDLCITIIKGLKKNLTEELEKQNESK